MVKKLVKFISGEDYHIDAIIQNKVYLSSVYQLNDFNELFLENSSWLNAQYLLDGNYNLDNKMLGTYNSIKKFIDALNNKDRALIESRASNRLLMISQNISNDVQDIYKTIELYKHYIYSTTGILSLSNYEVFKDDRASLMFAHYGNNLKGFALIYEPAELDSLKPITYTYHPSSSFDMIINIKNNLLPENICQQRELAFFKSPYWSYECEYRVLSEMPSQLVSMDSLGLKLTNIFYTERVDRYKKSIIEKILPDDVGFDEVFSAVKVNDGSLIPLFRVKKDNSVVFDLLNN
jgi:hypothetical protein